MRFTCTMTITAGLMLTGATAQGQWANFQDETDSRLVASSDLTVNPNLEHEAAHGDLDKDGWIDVVVVRKFPGSIQSNCVGTNILLMNEGGVLVDRTDEYATASDWEDDQGFLAITNDRVVKLVDVNGDGWLDIVTATTMSDQIADWEIGQPRCYMNLGENGSGDWLGIRYEHQRIPQLFAENGSVANPRFCDLAVADFTGDGYPDLFYVDYDTPETSGTQTIDLNGDGDTNDCGESQQSPGESPSNDFNNKLLINWGDDPAGPGAGYFYDSTNTRLSSAQLNAAFGNACDAGDMNGDGGMDIVWINTLTTGQNVGCLYNDPGNSGLSWNGPDQITGNAPYNQEICDLNNDGLLDVIVVDDSQDRYFLNNGNGADGLANFTGFTISDSNFEFGNTARCGDLDNDGFQDVLICDVDADLPSFCPSSGRRMHIYRNLGNTPNVTLDEVGEIIPNEMLSSSYDVSIFDINNDGWNDLVIYRCAGIHVWMNQPPVALSFTYPDGLPSVVGPGEKNFFQVQANPVGGFVVSGSARIYTSIDGGAFTSSPMANLGSDLYRASLPAVDCGQTVEFYIQAQLSTGGTFNDPSNAPAGSYGVIVATDLEVVVEESFEGSTAGWTVTNEGGLTAGAWEQADPNGTISGGAIASPEDAHDGSQCFTTQNGAPGGSAGSADVDNGTTNLFSPVYDLSDGATISYYRWMFTSDQGTSEEDFLVVSISNNGGSSWTTVEQTNGTGSSWEGYSFNVSDVISPSANMQLRFSVSDSPNNSITEAGVDALTIEQFNCDQGSPCPGDYNDDGQVNGEDLGALLGAWGTQNCEINLAGAKGCLIDGEDLGAFLGNWGFCK